MKNEFTFEFPDELGGQVMEITFWAEKAWEDWGNEPTHHDWRIVLQDAGVESALMYTDDPDDLTPVPVDLNAPEWKQHLDYLMPFLVEHAEESDYDDGGE
jgi:hypothetical protein